MGKVPHGRRKFQKFLYHRNQREKFIQIGPIIQVENALGSLAFWKIRNHKSSFYNFLHTLISEFTFLIQFSDMDFDIMKSKIFWLVILLVIITGVVSGLIAFFAFEKKVIFHPVLVYGPYIIWQCYFSRSDQEHCYQAPPLS